MKPSSIPDKLGFLACVDCVGKQEPAKDLTQSPGTHLTGLLHTLCYCLKQPPKNSKSKAKEQQQKP